MMAEKACLYLGSKCNMTTFSLYNRFIGGRHMGRALYGMPTLIECDSLNQAIELCKELKLDFIEINMNLPQYQKNNIDINMMKNCILNDNIFFRSCYLFLSNL